MIIQLNKVQQWNKVHVWIMMVGALIALFFGRLDILFAAASFSFVGLFFIAKNTLVAFKPIGGYCNWVTFLRFLILGSFCICYLPQHNQFLWLGLIVFAISLDGIDGFLARKYNHSSFFGQYFDMETDAFFVLMMCCFYFLYRDIPAWILIPGLLRYFYKIGIDFFPKQNFKESKKRYASTIAGVFFVVLCAGLLLNGVLLKSGLVIGSILIIVSFSISLLEYVRFND